MEKKKIAISLSKDLLKTIDTKIDGSRIRSRSQAIEVFTRKGLENQDIDTAVILLSKVHQKLALSQFKQSTVLQAQAGFFRARGITRIIVLVQNGNGLDKELENIPQVTVHKTDKKYNGEALFSIKHAFTRDFVVMSGDTYNNFNLKDMIEKHMQKDKLATMGLISHGKPSAYGTVTLSGDFIFDFHEKPKVAKSHIINAGIYIFKPAVFGLMQKTKSLECDLFPELAHMRQLVGYFTSGEYMHLSETKLI